MKPLPTDTQPSDNISLTSSSSSSYPMSEDRNLWKKNPKYPLVCGFLFIHTVLKDQLSAIILTLRMLSFNQTTESQENLQKLYNNFLNWKKLHVAHSKGEEEFLFPNCQQLSPHNYVQFIKNENGHERIDSLIDNIQRKLLNLLHSPSEQFKKKICAGFDSLNSMLQTHYQEEESCYFPTFINQLTPQQLGVFTPRFLSEYINFQSLYQLSKPKTKDFRNSILKEFSKEFHLQLGILEDLKSLHSKRLQIEQFWENLSVDDRQAVVTIDHPRLVNLWQSKINRVKALRRTRPTLDFLLPVQSRDSNYLELCPSFFDLYQKGTTLQLKLSRRIASNPHQIFSVLDRLTGHLFLQSPLYQIFRKMPSEANSDILIVLEIERLLRYRFREWESDEGVNDGELIESGEDLVDDKRVKQRKKNREKRLRNKENQKKKKLLELESNLDLPVFPEPIPPNVPPPSLELYTISSSSSSSPSPSPSSSSLSLSLPPQIELVIPLDDSDDEEEEEEAELIQQDADYERTLERMESLSLTGTSENQIWREESVIIEQWSEEEVKIKKKLQDIYKATDQTLATHAIELSHRKYSYSVQLSHLSLNPVDQLFILYQLRGTYVAYNDGLSHLQHALQCATLAEYEGAPPHQIAAAFLHDIGCLLSVDANHEEIGCKFLSQCGFLQDVTLPILYHMLAEEEEEALKQQNASGNHGSASRHARRNNFQLSKLSEQPYFGDTLALIKRDQVAQKAFPYFATPNLEHFRSFLEVSLLTSY